MTTRPPARSACARRSTSPTSPRSRASRAAAATGRPPASPPTRRSRRSWTSSTASSSPRVPPPRALSPAGLVLVDKEPGPSSFAVVARVRRRTGARAGHAGTLDPFATGLLLVLLGAATKLAGRFVGLDKRYLTDVDLGAVSSTGDPEGELTPREPPSREELEVLLEGLRGEVELPVPAFSAVKIEGKRAYRLARAGTAVEMPVRRSTVRSLA